MFKMRMEWHWGVQAEACKALCACCISAVDAEVTSSKTSLRGVALES